MACALRRFPSVCVAVRRSPLTRRRISLCRWNTMMCRNRHPCCNSNSHHFPYRNRACRNRSARVLPWNFATATDRERATCDRVGPTSVRGFARYPHRPTAIHEAETCGHRVAVRHRQIAPADRPLHRLRRSRSLAILAAVTTTSIRRHRKWDGVNRHRSWCRTVGLARTKLFRVPHRAGYE